MMNISELKNFIKRVHRSSLERSTLMKNKLQECCDYTSNTFPKKGKQLIPELQSYAVGAISESTKLLSTSSQEYMYSILKEQHSINSLSDLIFLLKNELDRQSHVIAQQQIHHATVNPLPLSLFKYDYAADLYAEPFGRQNILDVSPYDCAGYKTVTFSENPLNSLSLKQFGL